MIWPYFRASFPFAELLTRDQNQGKNGLVPLWRALCKHRVPIWDEEKGSLKMTLSEKSPGPWMPLKTCLTLRSCSEGYGTSCRESRGKYRKKNHGQNPFLIVHWLSVERSHEVYQINCISNYWLFPKEKKKDNIYKNLEVGEGEMNRQKDICHLSFVLSSTVSKGLWCIIIILSSIVFNKVFYE